MAAADKGSELEVRSSELEQVPSLRRRRKTAAYRASELLVVPILGSQSKAAEDRGFGPGVESQG